MYKCKFSQMALNAESNNEGSTILKCQVAKKTNTTPINIYSSHADAFQATRLLTGSLLLSLRWLSIINSVLLAQPAIPADLGNLDSLLRFSSTEDVSHAVIFSWDHNFCKFSGQAHEEKKFSGFVQGISNQKRITECKDLQQLFNMIMTSVSILWK